jgi:hypothetical protein
VRQRVRPQPDYVFGAAQALAHNTDCEAAVAIISLPVYAPLPWGNKKSAEDFSSAPLPKTVF